MTARWLLTASATLALTACGGGGTESPQTGSPPVAGTPTPTPTPAPTPTVPRTQLIRRELVSHLNDAPVGLLADPPTVTPGRANAGTAVSSARLVGTEDAGFRYIGLMTTVPIAGYTYVTNAAVNTGTARTSNTFFIEFQTDAPMLELLTRGDGDAGAFRIMVDGSYVSLDSIVYPAGGAVYRTRIDFRGVRANRLIRIEAARTVFAGVTIGTGDSFTRPTGDEVTAVFLGDSGTQGTVGITGFPYQAYPVLTANQMGWRHLYQSGVSGTGYIAAPNGTLRFIDRLETDVYPIDPEVLFISGGYNDPTTGLETAAGQLFNAIATRLPDTLVFVMGPFDPKQTRSPQRDAIRRAVGTRPNFYFIDNIAERWQTGTGNVAQPKGDGNADQFVAADGIHATLAGHQNFADRLTAAFKAVIRTFAGS